MRKALILATAAALAVLAGPGMAAAPAGNFVRVPYATWSNSEPLYQLYPGDEVEISFPTNPEYNKTLTVRPDGRVTLPILGDMEVAGRPIDDVRADTRRAYATQFRNPNIDMAVKPQPIRVSVGGEVGAPGDVSLIADDNALQAIIRAGGVKTTGNLKRVQIIRRGAAGSLMMTEVDLSKAFRHGEQPDLAPLARGDIVYVPRTGIANVDLAVQSFVAALPFTLNYSLNATTTSVTKVKP